MSEKKYKIKMQGGKILGPLSEDEVYKMAREQAFTGNEFFQELPKTQWKEIIELLSGNEGSSIHDKIQKAREEVSLEEKEKEDFLNEELLKDHVEFQVDKKITQELDKNLSAEEREKLQKETEKIDETKSKISRPKRDVDDFEQTIVRPLSKKGKEELKRLKKEKEQAIKEKEEKERQSQEKDEEGEEEAIEEKEETNVDVSAEETKVVNLKKERSKILSQLKDSERALIDVHDLKEQKLENEGEFLEEENDDEAEVEQKKKRKRPFYLAAIAIIAGFFILEMFDTGVKKGEGLSPIYPRIVFPPKRGVGEKEKSKKLEKEGDIKYKRQGYSNTLMAAKSYGEALAYDFDNRTALGKLILTYSELYLDSIRPYRDAETITKLIRIAEKKIPNDPNYVTGMAIFFYRLDRPRSTINAIENFLKINKRSSHKLMRFYLLAMLQLGMDGDAKKILEQLVSIKNKDINAYLAIAQYYMEKEDFTKADATFNKAKGEYPGNIELLIEYGEILLQKEDFAALSKVLEDVKEISFDRSVYFYSQFLRYMGIIAAVKNKEKAAIAYFRKSLKIKENTNLRKKLENLEVGPGKKDGLYLFINENKTIRLIQKSKKELLNENFNLAIAHAIKAVDLNPRYYPAVKQLVKVQIQRGLFKNAIDLLIKYIKKNEGLIDARFDLIEVYTHAFKFGQAEEEISKIARITPQQDKRFKYLLGKLYLFKKNYVAAIDSFQKALEKDPLNDEIFFILAEIYFKYKKFKEAKSFVIKAIELNPGIVKYRSLYGQILFEIDGTDVAIGYSRKLLEEFKDHPLLIGDIAKYYYKSGQEKQFEEQLQKIKSLKRENSQLYQALFDNALLEGNAKEMIKYGRELNRLAPGEMAKNLEFSERLIEIKRYDEALEILINAIDRLPSFPRLYYLIGKIYLAKGDQKKAIKSIETEIEKNPHLPDSYILLGQIYLEQKDLNKARTYFVEAQKKAPEDPDALYGVANVNFLLLRYEEALQLLQKAGKIVPDEPKIKLLLGYTYEKMGQRILAKKAFLAYLKLVPDAKNKGIIQRKINKLK